LATPRAFKPPDGGVPLGRPWMSTDGQGTKWRRNIAKNFNQLSRVHKRYRRTDDRPAIAYSELKNALWVVMFTEEQTTLHTPHEHC